MRTSSRTTAAVLASVTLAGTAVVAGASSAFALGALPADGTTSYVTPTSGNNNVRPTVELTQPCATGSTTFLPYLHGPGLDDAGQPMNNGPADVPAGAFTFQTGKSFTQTAQDAGTAIVAGSYVIRTICQDDLGNVLTTFTAPVTFSSATAYSTPAKPKPASTIAITTVTPASPAPAGSTATITATVTPSAATGSVQFVVDGADVGSPVSVSGGTASYTTGVLASGAHSFAARFLGVSHADSTSAAFPYTVQRGNTTTSLAVSPAGTQAQYQPVVLTATVTPAAATGDIVFKDGATVLATRPLGSGSATYTASDLALGDHSFTAEYVPADPPGQYNASGSNTVPYSITASAGPAPVNQDLEVFVEAGALTITVPVNPTVVLPTPALNAAGSLLVSSGKKINTVRVTDTRAGNVGWTVNGVVSEFRSGVNAINSGNLGWTPERLAQGPSQTVVPGAVVAAGNGLAPGATAPTGVGLAEARTLANAAAGAGIGTADLTAALTLQAPTSTRAGTYTARMTLTAI